MVASSGGGGGKVSSLLFGSLEAVEADEAAVVDDL